MLASLAEWRAILSGRDFLALAGSSSAAHISAYHAARRLPARARFLFELWALARGSIFVRT